MIPLQKIYNRCNKEYIHLYSLLFIYIPRIPAILRNIWCLYNDTWEKQSNAPVGAFSQVDMGYRAWYDKIAQDYSTRGRFGYAWDDGLGMGMGPRCYNSWMTYLLLQKMGVVRYCVAGYILMVFAATVTAWLLCGVIWGGVVGAICAISPLLISYFTHAGKPEMLWWPFSFVALALLLTGNYFAAGLLWSLLAYCNLSCSLMLVMYCGLFAVVRSIHDAQILPFLFALLPGGLKVAVRLFFMYRSGFMVAITQEQAGIWHRPFLPSLGELFELLPFTGAMICAWVVAGEPTLFLLWLNAIIMCWSNWRILYHNDPESITLCLMSISLAACLYAGTLFGLLFVFWLLFPYLTILPLSRDALPFESFRLSEMHLARNFPCFSPVSQRYLPQALDNFFSTIPDGARILAEFDGDPRSGSPLRSFWTWLDYFLPLRNVDLSNEIYTRFVNKELCKDQFEHFHHNGMTSLQMLSLATQLGASHVIAYSPEMKNALEHAGFRLIAKTHSSEFSDEKFFLPIPQQFFFLLATPGSPSLIDGITTYKRAGSALYWKGKAEQRYRIRYNYSPSFVARQGGKLLSINSYQPFTGVNTQFMEITSQSDDEILLWYRPFPSWVPDCICHFFSKRH